MKKQMTLALMLAAGLAVGCDQSEVDEATSTTESVAEEAKESTGGMLDQAKEAGEKLKDQGATAIEEGKAKGEEVVETIKEKTDEMIGGADDVGIAGMSLADLQSADSLDEGQATSAFSHVTQLIKDQNFDDADQWIAALEKVGLPAGYADKLVSLKDTLAKAKDLDLGAAGDMLKGLGGGK